MNKIIKNKIYKENLKLLGLGILLIIGGGILNIIVYESGWITILLVVPFIGAGLFFYSLYRLVYYPANPAYKCWENYGEEDKNVNEVMELIKKSEIGGDSKDLIFSDKWIIQPSSLIFVKPKDVNWAFIHREGQGGSKNYNQKIKVFTNFNLEFEILCSSIYVDKSELDNLISQDVAFYFTKLKKYNKNIILGYSEELQNLWGKDPKNFSKNIKMKG
jgi:hypothetical protein